MSKKPRFDPRSQTCAWCGKKIQLTANKGLIPPHQTPGNQRCVGTGMAPITPIPKPP